MNDMNTSTATQPIHLDITLEENAVVADIRRALKMIRGIASVRQARTSGITPALKTKIDKARQDYNDGKCTECRTHEELDAFLQSL